MNAKIIMTISTVFVCSSRRKRPISGVAIQKMIRRKCHAILRVSPVMIRNGVKVRVVMVVASRSMSKNGRSIVIAS